MLKKLSEFTLEKKQYWLLIALVLSTGFSMASLNTFQIGTYMDDAWYINTATALATGQGFSRIWFPQPVPETNLPIGYPLALSVIRLFFPQSFLPLQLFSLLCVLVTLYLSVKVFDAYLSPFLYITYIFLVSVNTNIVGASHQVMSEAFYLMLTFIVFALVQASEHSGQQKWLAIICAFVATYGFFTRGWGGALVVSLVAYWLINKKWKSALFTVLIFVASVILWSWRNASLGGSGVINNLGADSDAVRWYVGRLLNSVSTLDDVFLDQMSTIIMPLFLGPRFLQFFGAARLMFVPYLLAASVSLAIVAGWIRHFISGRGILMNLYVFFYLLILIQAPGLRYWIPLIPFVIYYFLIGVEWGIQVICDRIRKPLWAPFMALAIFSMVFILHLGRDFQEILDPVRNRIPDVASGSTWIADNTPDDAIVMALVPRVSYLYSSRKTIPYPDAGDTHLFPMIELTSTGKKERFIESIDFYQVSYVLVEPMLRSGLPMEWSPYIQEDIIPVLQENPLRFRLVYRNADDKVRIYQVAHEQN